MAEENEFKEARKQLIRMIRSVQTAVDNFGKDDVQEYDVSSGNLNTLLSQIRTKLDAFSLRADDLLDDIEEAEIDAVVKTARTNDIDSQR